MKIKRIFLPILVLSVSVSCLSAQDWRRVDPTSWSRDERQPRNEPRTNGRDDEYGELRLGDRGDRGRQDREARDYRPSDVWQVEGRSNAGTFSIEGAPQQAAQALPDSKRPWSSTYFPFQDCALVFAAWSPDRMSPMELYDSYVLAKTGKNPGAAAWEASSVAKTLVVGGNESFGRPELVWSWKLGHNMAPWLIEGRRDQAQVPYTDAQGRRQWREIQVDWWGHCNGWAAASILVPEPPEKLTVEFDRPARRVLLKYRDAKSVGRDTSLGDEAYVERPHGNSRTLTFTGADLKALYTEAYLSTATRLSHPDQPSFYGQGDGGRRYDPARGGSQAELADAYRDIHPHNFHKIMTDHMEREKGLVAEKDANEEVNNLPIVGWRYDRSYNERQHAYDFRARVYFADYAPPTYRGTKSLAIDYTYRVNLDRRSNRATDSLWLGNSVHEHPDFVWVPDRPIPAPLKRNPSIEIEVLDEIVRTGRRG